MQQNIPLALFMGVLASGCYAFAAILQHKGVSSTFGAEATTRLLTPRRVLAMVSNKWWLLGIGLILTGAVGHFFGISMAPVAVVQPIGILAVPFSVMLAARRNHTRPTAGMLVAIVLSIVGITGFTIISAKSAATHAVIDLTLIGIVAPLILLVSAALAFLGLRGPYATRCLLSACAGAFLFGLATATMKTTIELWNLGNRFDSWEFWVMLAGPLVCYASGGWLVQQAYASGPAEIVVGTMTVVDPLVAVTFGLVVLGEAQNIGVVAGIGMAIMALIAIAGAGLGSRYHPDAARQFRRPAPTVPAS